MCTSWCVHGQAHHCLADNDTLIILQITIDSFLSQGPSAIDQGSEHQLAKVRKFWHSLSTGQCSEILTTSLDDIWAKLLDVTDDGECCIAYIKQAQLSCHVHSRSFSAQEQHVVHALFAEVCRLVNVMSHGMISRLINVLQTFQAHSLTCYTRQEVPHMQHHEQLIVLTQSVPSFCHTLFAEATAKVQEGIRRLCENGSCKRWQWTTGQRLFLDEKAFRC